MSFLASNFCSPEAAVSGVEKWMVTVRYEKENGAPAGQMI